MASSPIAHSYVHTEVSTFMQGDEISGTVNIEVIQSIAAEQLLLVIRGLEMTHWVEYANLKKSIKLKEITHKITSGNSYAGNSLSFERSSVIHKFDGCLNPGQYTIPFSIKLPANVSPSFNHSQFMKATRYYTIKAELDNSQYLRAHQNVIIIKSKPEEMKHSTPISVSLRLVLGRCWCFGSKNVSMVSMNLEKNHYFMNEMIRGFLVVDHSLCDKKLVRISFSLKRNIKVNNNSTEERDLVESIAKYSSIVNFIDKPEVKVGFPFGFELFRAEGLEESPSTESALIRCQYHVSARLMYDSNTVGSNCEISTSVIIYNSILSDAELGIINSK